jgi:nucleoid-associated protein YgaU
MTSRPNSRYANDPVTVVTTERGTHQSVNVPTPLTRIFHYTEYMVEDGESIDLLAFDFLGDGELWWMIADANPEILDWAELAPGTVIRIPRV